MALLHLGHGPMPKRPLSKDRETGRRVGVCAQEREIEKDVPAQVKQETAEPCWTLTSRLTEKKKTGNLLCLIQSSLPAYKTAYTYTYI